MGTIIARFRDGTRAREAVGTLHSAGVSEKHIRFHAAGPHRPDQFPSAAPESDSARSGARLAGLATDAGRAAMRLTPVIGRQAAESPVARELANAVETAGALAGGLAGALSETLEGNVERAPPTDGHATVIVTADANSEDEISALLNAAGAVTVTLLK